ncbi:MAG: effector-binding domain-containing protein [Vicingaceae bacterium]|jgi:effector-binding domain-containing protein
MKFLKWLLIILAAIIAIVMIYGATQPSQMTIEESIDINAAASVVFEEIKDFESWDKWSAWSKMDTNMEQSYEGKIGELGYKNTWNSENWNVGIGSQEVVEIRDDEYMKTKMFFNGSAEANYASFTLTENEGKTIVVWDMVGAVTPFYARIMNTLFKPMIVESYQTSLKELKSIVENKSIVIPNPLNIEVVEVESISIISIKDSCSVEEVSRRMTEIYTELGIFMGMKGIEASGNSLSLYYKYTPEKVIFELAFPVSGEVIGEARVHVSEIAEGKAIKAIHIGDYEGLERVHVGMEEYSKLSNIELADYFWEVYLNQGNGELETHVYYRIK